MRSPLLYTLIFILIYSCSKPESFSDLIVQQNSLIPGLNVESSYLKDQLISFNMIDSEGNNITSNTSFTVDNQLINGNTISYDEIGSHDVSANYTIDSQNYSTDLIVFNIVEPINKVIVEDYTGTWCGYCPPVAHAIYELKEVYDNIISVGIHNNDELTIDQESDLRSELGISGFPSARLNRTISWFDPYQISEVNSLLSEENNVAISIKSALENIDLEVNLRIVSNVELVNHKLVIYLVESNLIYDQSNYFNYVEDSYFYNLGNPIENYSHQDVLRKSITNISGNTLDLIQPLTDYKFNFNVEISPDFVQENLAIVAMVVDSNNNAINSQFSEVNSFQDFN
ncbi:Omp28-related outer membrane protein [Flavobacteriaceae bacterium]|jgi:thiol-disulfide isomerase/thioredoxin|nr:Omp28-related outer membrane protein [Flavobacteriaceae bacterium]